QLGRRLPREAVRTGRRPVAAGPSLAGRCPPRWKGRRKEIAGRDAGRRSAEVPAGRPRRGRSPREHPVACTDVPKPSLAPLAELPGVAEAVARARAAVDEVHEHPVNRRGWPTTAAEASVRAARASAA